MYVHMLFHSIPIHSIVPIVQVVLQNVGDIEARYQLLPSPEGSRFTFAPDHGTLGIPEEHTLAGDMSERHLPHEQTLEITFTSESIGEFTETLLWALEGTAEPLRLVFHGCVIGPTCHFDETLLDYGVVSYGFKHTRTLTLHNTSEIPMRYRMYVVEDGRPTQAEWVVTPQQATIPARSTGQMTVEFTPETVKKYLQVI